MIPEIIFEFPEVPQFNFLIDLQGESLYQKWLQLGLGTGDYTAFLEWLKVKGDKGASAYDVAVELGFVGTQAEWVASLKGEKGDKGDAGTTLHENLTDKNSEAAVQHVDTTVTKETLAEADKVPLWDSVTGNIVLTAKSNFVEAKPDVWYPLTLSNGWVNVSETDKASFLKDSIGVIHLRGRIKDGLNGTVGFVLPLGFYREGVSMEHPLVSGYGAYGRLLIVTNGTCYINVDYNVNVDLSNISFKL